MAGQARDKEARSMRMSLLVRVAVRHMKPCCRASRLGDNLQGRASRLAIATLHATCLACTALVDLPGKHAVDSTTDDLDVLEAVDSTIETMPDTSVDTFPDLADVIDLTEEEAADLVEDPACGPTDDCDGDGATPLGGDCCDSDFRVTPWQTEWFYESYACPDPSWDYNCSGDIEYEQADLGHGLDASVGEGCAHISFYTCSSTNPEGWVDGPPFCGELEVYEDCWAVSGPGWQRCETRSELFNGIMGCH